MPFIWIVPFSAFGVSESNYSEETEAAPHGVSRSQLNGGFPNRLNILTPPLTCCAASNEHLNLSEP